jgi:transposase
VATLEGLSYDEVEGIYLRHGATQLAAQRVQPFRVLGVDEIALQKGHGHFVLVLSAPEQSRVVAVLAERSQATLEKWLDELAPEQRAAIECVCIDRWEPYRQAIQQKLPQAKIVAGHFHVQKNLNDALTKARREVQRQAPDEVREALKGCRGLLVRNREALTPEQRTQLETACAACPELQTCYELKEAFRQGFTLPDRASAEPALVEWQVQVKQSGVKAFEPFLTTLRNWGQYILNYFDERLRSGCVEGMNNKIKLLIRIAFGFRNFDHFALRVRVECAPPAMLPH